MANVLILTLTFRPDNVSTAQIMGDLALDLQACGHEVFVITTVPHFNEDAEALAAQPLQPYLGRLIQRSDYNGIKVLHVWMPRKGKNIFTRIIAWFGFHAISTLSGLIVRFKPDVILAPSPPLTIGVSAWLLCLWHKCKYIYNVQEIYPDIAVNLGVLRNKCLIKLLKKMESFVYAKASVLAVISERMAAHVREKNVPKKKVRLIPNFVDVADFRLLPKDNDFSRRHKLQDRFVVSYAGNMGKPQGLDVLIEAAYLLRHETKIHFLLMGDGSERNSLIDQAQRRKLLNITILPYQPYSFMAAAYAASDTSFVSQAPDTSRDGIPSKVYRIMACGRPVIASTSYDSDLALLVRQADGGVVVESGNAQALANAIKQAFEEGDAWLEKGFKARLLILQDYSRAAISDRYHALILELQHNDFR